MFATTTTIISSSVQMAASDDFDVYCRQNQKNVMNATFCDYTGNFGTVPVARPVGQHQNVAPRNGGFEVPCNSPSVMQNTQPATMRMPNNFLSPMSMPNNVPTKTSGSASYNNFTNALEAPTEGSRIQWIPMVDPGEINHPAPATAPVTELVQESRTSTGMGKVSIDPNALAQKKEKNRLAARRVRVKQKQYMHLLEKRVITLEDQNQFLIKKLKMLNQMYFTSK